MHQHPFRFAQKHFNGFLPSGRLYNDRHNVCQLEIRNGLVKTNPCLRIFPGAAPVCGLENLAEFIEPGHVPGIPHAEQPQMSHEMCYVKHRVILAKLIEIERRDAPFIKNKMVRRKIAMSRSGRPAGKRYTALFDSTQDTLEKAV